MPCTTHSQFSGRFLPHGLSQLQFPQVDEGCAEYSPSLSLLFSVPGSTSSSQPQPLETLPGFAQGPASGWPSSHNRRQTRRGGAAHCQKDRGKLRRGRKVKVSRNPQSLWRTEHEDTQGQREETGTVPSGDGHGGHSRDGTLTQDNMSLMRERRGGG